MPPTSSLRMADQMEVLERTRMSREMQQLSDEAATELLLRQDRLQAEARQVVRELDLVTLLGQAGPVVEHGSVTSGLMAWPDLDFGVTSPDLERALAFEIMRPLLAHPRTTMARYTNETGARSFSGSPRDERLFFMVYYEHTSEVVWKLDIAFWLYPEPRGEERYHARIAERLTDETRLAILWLKDLWHSTPVYPATVGSVDIYDAVLEHGARTPNDFDDYLQARGKPTWAEATSTRRKARDL
jgi:hypothetical protein